MNVGGHTALYGTWEPGWRWSDHIKPIAGTDSCEVTHLLYCLSGRMEVVMDDGSEGEMGPGDMAVDPARPRCVGRRRRAVRRGRFRRRRALREALASTSEPDMSGTRFRTCPERTVGSAGAPHRRPLRSCLLRPSLRRPPRGGAPAHPQGRRLRPRPRRRRRIQAAELDDGADLRRRRGQTSSSSRSRKRRTSSRSGSSKC